MSELRIQIGLAIVIGAAGLMAGIAVSGIAAGHAALQVVAVVLAVAAGLGALGLARLARRWELRLEQLRGWVNLVSGEREMVRRDVSPNADAIDRVQLAIIDMMGLRLDQQATVYRKLEEVLNALPDAVVVLTPEGLISLVNAAGRPLFGAGGSVIGKSAFDTLSRQTLDEAIERSRAEGRSVSCSLATVWDEVFPASVAVIDRDGSVLLRFSASQATTITLEHDLSLHERPPAMALATADTGLANLPALVIDTETTGLQPGRDRVISVGAARLLGPRLFRSGMLNLLVNPGRVIPTRTIAIHGISNAMVADAPPFSSVAQEVCKATQDIVLIGHHIGFDVQMLQHEMHLSGIDWQPMAMVDVLVLYAGLFPEQDDLSLEGIAKTLQVPVIGRHSALGDALTTGEIFARLIPRLIERGVGDLGALRAFQAEVAASLRATNFRRSDQSPT